MMHFSAMFNEVTSAHYRDTRSRNDALNVDSLPAADTEKEAEHIALLLLLKLLDVFKGTLWRVSDNPWTRGCLALSSNEPF
jgi:hypothetical protein